MNWRSYIPDQAGERFRLLADAPALAGLWDLAIDDEAARYWLRILRNNADYLHELTAQQARPDMQAKAAAALAIFGGLIDDFDRREAARELRTVHEITLVRDHILRSFGLMDPYDEVKARESRKLLATSREAIERGWEWGESPSEDHIAIIMTDLLTGNLFDLGSTSTQLAFRRGELDYDGARVRHRVAVGEWLAGLDAKRHAILAGDERPLGEPAAGRMLFFADNSGPDFLLGVLPAAAFWARRWEVCLVVNSLPVSSDVAIAEARALLADVCSSPDGAHNCPLSRAQECGRLRLVESGTGSPGIDFSHVGRELNEAARGASWIVIEGQGRAIETNWTTRFTCPVLRVAVAKDRLVAHAIGRQPGEPVLRWDWPVPGSGSSGSSP